MEFKQLVERFAAAAAAGNGDALADLFTPDGTYEDYFFGPCSGRDAIKAMLARSDTQAKLLTMGLDSLTSTPEDFAAFIKSEVAKWAPVVKASGAKVE